jgi:hypothetical protein
VYQSATRSSYRTYRLGNLGSLFAILLGTACLVAGPIAYATMHGFRVIILVVAIAIATAPFGLFYLAIAHFIYRLSRGAVRACRIVTIIQVTLQGPIMLAVLCTSPLDPLVWKTRGPADPGEIQADVIMTAIFILLVILMVLNRKIIIALGRPIDHRHGLAPVNVHPPGR